MQLIPLTKGYFAMVDDADFKWLSSVKWHSKVKRNTVYAERTFFENGKKVTLKMHRAIMSVTDKDVFIDHRDGNGLNNSRDNLRVCTNSQNIMNAGSYAGSSSRFKGVYRIEKTNKWLSNISVNGRLTHIGLFENEEDAARNWNKFAKEHRGEFAKLNDVFPPFP